MLLREEDTPDGFVIRTDFSDAEGWRRICDVIRESFADFGMNVQFVQHREHDGASPQQMLPLLEGNPFYSFAFIVDRISIESPEFPVVVLDLYDKPGRTFRVIPSNLPIIHANLWLANMDFQDYADSVDPDGIFRGFPES